MKGKITLKAVSHSYANAHPIEFKDWEIANGEKWLLLGASGSGKTTLLHILTGLLIPKKGEITVDGTSLYTLKAKALDHFRGKHMGIVFQRPHLIKSLTVTENLMLAQTFAQVPENKQRIREVLESLDMVQKQNAYPSALSEGQLQRVSIARAVINKPTLLIADEPTSSLDDKNAQAVLNLLMQQTDLNNTTLVVATHDQRVKDTFSNRYELT